MTVLPRRLVLPVLLVLAAPALVGCSSLPRYSADAACSIAASTVEQMLGTDRFTASAANLPPLRTQQTDPPGPPCTIESSDAGLTVSAEVADSRSLEVARDNLRLAGEPYDLDGGTALAAKRGGTWICANVRIEIVLDDRGVVESEDAMRQALEALAGAVGCYDAAADRPD